MRSIHFADQQMTSIDSVNVTGLSILLRIPSHSNQVQNQTSDSIKQALLIYYYSAPPQPFPSADAKAPFQWSHHPPLQFLPEEMDQNILQSHHSKPKTGQYISVIKADTYVIKPATHIQITKKKNDNLITPNSKLFAQNFHHFQIRSLQNI